MSDADPPRGESVVSRAFRLLGAFDTAGESLTLTSLSSRTRLPKPTTLRLTRELMEQGALERLDDGRYVLGLRLLELASLAPRGHGLRSVALPHMEDLHIATGQHVLLAVREGDESLLVERLSAHDAGKVMYRVGGRMPLHSTGVGRVLLAYAPLVIQEDVLSRSLLVEPERIPISSRQLRAVLASVRREGHAVMSKSLPEPMSSVAAPLYGPRREVVAALSVITPTSAGRKPAVRAALLAVARAISRQLGASDNADRGVKASH